MNENPSYRSDTVDADIELRSILKYVQHILSTKQGSTVISYDFGIPDVTNFHDKSYGEYITEMENSLVQTILKFEPRLKDVRVMYVKQENKTTVMHFKIEARLLDYKDIPVIFETVINPDGKISIYE